MRRHLYNEQLFNTHSSNFSPRLYSAKRLMSSSLHNSLQKWCESLPLCFGIHSKNIEVVCKPSTMYDKIMGYIKTSKKRIGVASLYLGNGQLEMALVSQLKKSLESNSDLKAHILLDFTRGSRGDNNSRTMLLPCIAEHSNQMKLSLYHTPNLKGAMKRVLPDRFNELLGLQHMKAYIFDDTIILSGANLSHDYFTNRQDRCIVIKDSPQLCDYFYSLIETVAGFSYQVDAQNKSKLHDSCKGDPTKNSETAKFVKHASSRVEEFLSYNKMSHIDCCEKPDTWVYPLIQMGSFSINQDQTAMRSLLLSDRSDDKVYMSTAYFNPSHEYIDLITRHCHGEYHLLTASPQANGFLNAKGIAGYIPMGYRWYEKFFVEYVNKYNQDHRVKLHEFSRKNWTFHSKGLWFYPKDSRLPTMTAIGSSNFGYRSIHLDLEAQVILKTDNQELQQSLHLEKNELFSHSAPVDGEFLDCKDKPMPIWTRMAAYFGRYYF